MALPFLNRQAKRRDQVVAIDLGGRTTKAVHVHRRGDRFSLTNYALLDAPLFEKNLSVDVLADHLKNVARLLGCTRAREVTLALGVADTLFRQVELPLMPLSDMRQMLKFNSKTYLQQDLADYVFDCWILAGKPAEGARPASGIQKQRVAVGGARKQIVDELHGAIKVAGLVPDQVVPGLVGPINAFEMAEPEAFSKEVVALVDVGFKNSTIAILDSGEIRLNRVVGIGGDRLTGGLSEILGISYAEAEQIKLGMPSEVQANLDPLLHPLSRELRASIDFFENNHDKTVSQAFISGGSARSDFIIQALQTELMVPCRSWNATKFMEMALPPEKMGELEQIAPQLTVAVGAAAAAF